MTQLHARELPAQVRKAYTVTITARCIPQQAVISRPPQICNKIGLTLTGVCLVLLRSLVKCAVLVPCLRGGVSHGEA